MQHWWETLGGKKPQWRGGKGAQQSFPCWHLNFRWQCLPQLLQEPCHQSPPALPSWSSCKPKSGPDPSGKVGFGGSAPLGARQGSGCPQWVLLSSDGGTGTMGCHCPCPPSHLRAVLISEAKAQTVPECLTGHLALVGASRAPHAGRGPWAGTNLSYNAWEALPLLRNTPVPAGCWLG